MVEEAADATELDALVLELAGLVADAVADAEADAALLVADAAVLVAAAEGGVVKDTLWGVAEGPEGLIDTVFGARLGVRMATLCLKDVRGAHSLCWRARAACWSAAEQCSWRHAPASAWN